MIELLSLLVAPMQSLPIVQIYAENRGVWRDWLKANHQTSQRIALVYYKKSSGKPSVTYAEAVEEALCFGWIDSQLKPIDGEKYQQNFTPRRTKSGWSKVNKARVEKMIAAGSMTDAGLAKINLAKEDGSWNALDGSENVEIPDDLSAALKSRKRAYENFMNFNLSTKKSALRWVYSAKRPNTRQERIDKIAASSAKNEKPTWSDADLMSPKGKMHIC